MLNSQKQTVMHLIKLKAGISVCNFFAIVIHNVVLGFFLNGVELLQQLILSDSNYYGFSPGEALQTNANLILFDLFVRLIFAPLYGFLIDKFGRKKMIVVGYVLTTLGIVSFPIHGYFPKLNSLFPWYYMARFAYANGTTIILLMPFIADYIEDESKGKAVGINAVANAIGFLLSTTFIRSFYGHAWNLKYIYLFAAGIISSFGMLYTIFLKGGSDYYRVIPESDSLNSSLSANSDLVHANRQVTTRFILNSIKQKPWIKASFIFAFLNGANLGILTQVLNLFVQSLPGSPDPGYGSQVVFYANIGGVISTILLGLLLDSIRPFYIAVCVLILSVSGYGSSRGITGQTDPLVIFVGVISGISYSSCQVLMNYLGFVHYPEAIRGRLYALANFISFFGNLLISVIGGNLVRYANQHIPFYIMAGSSLLALAVFTILYFRTIKRWEKKQRRESERYEQLILSYHKDLPTDRQTGSI